MYTDEGRTVGEKTTGELLAAVLVFKMFKFVLAFSRLLFGLLLSLDGVVPVTVSVLEVLEELLAGVAALVLAAVVKLGVLLVEF